MTDTQPGCAVCHQPAEYVIPRRLRRPVGSCARHYTRVWRAFVAPRRHREALTA